MVANLDEAITQAGGVVPLLWNSHSRTALAARVPAEYTNWRSEQLAWRESAVLYTQSHHMTDLFLRGRDALKLISDLGVNSVANFQVDMAKQFVAVTENGDVIGDNILFHLADDEFQMVGTNPAASWVQYHAEKGGYDVDVTRDDDSTFRPGDPVVYRFQVQGPRALEVIERAIGARAPKLRFFEMTHFTIAGKHVRALRHGMAGTPGFELFGPWEDELAVHEALVAAGVESDLVRVGNAAYHTTALESGWWSRPLPGFYSGDEHADFRRWLGTDSYEATAPLGGSLHSDDIRDYYLTPYDLGYGRIVKFDHDFVGRDALEAMVSDGRHEQRTKVTLVWNGDDVEKMVGGMFHDGPNAKHLQLPLSRYADFQYDRVTVDGADVGFSGIVGYSANYRSMLSLAVIDSAKAKPGTEVSVVWGESPNSAKLQVEPHEQVTLRATVQPAPLDEYSRTTYRQN